MADAKSPRARRLAADHQRMVELAARSDLMSFEVQDLVPGTPPEKYLVTYTCKGIAGIHSDRRPIFSYRHQVMIYLDINYPKAPPKMRWLTPVWQPNIEHVEPFRVCIDPGWWAAARTLDQLCVMLAEMIQYKNYHADLKQPPFPMDKEVARWVTDHAEPRGIVSKTKPVDDRELCRPQRVRAAQGERSEPKPPAQKAIPIRIRPKKPKSRIRIVDAEPNTNE